ncbi:MAG: peptidylprolyl isomerase [Pyrinomonadaceae bacterium]|nr:peptidylprolyl isomerase [Pyrinomonadaceae bacterium]
MIKTLFRISLIGGMLAAAAFGQAVSPSPAPAATPIPKANARPETKIEPNTEPFDTADVATMASKCVKFDTEAGDIEIELYPESARETVRNFLNLVAIGALDTTTFSRVVPGFVIQGGNLYSREGKMTYALGMRARKVIPDEPNKILHERGVLSMARTDEPNTATTNFFILVGPGAHLDGTFAAFGRVTNGMETVDAINKAPVTEEKPDRPVRIRTARINACTGATPR